MKWFLSSKVEVPESPVTDDDINKLKQKASEITEDVEKLGQAVMDGEAHWMLVKCFPKEKAVCEPEEPILCSKCSQTI